MTKLHDAAVRVATLALLASVATPFFVFLGRIAQAPVGFWNAEWLALLARLRPPGEVLVCLTALFVPRYFYICLPAILALKVGYQLADWHLLNQKLAATSVHISLNSEIVHWVRDLAMPAALLVWYVLPSNRAEVTEFQGRWYNTTPPIWRTLAATALAAVAIALAFYEPSDLFSVYRAAVRLSIDTPPFRLWLASGLLIGAILVARFPRWVPLVYLTACATLAMNWIVAPTQKGAMTWWSPEFRHALVLATLGIGLMVLRHWHLHSCKRGRSTPKTNANFWRDKREGNRRRDRRVRDKLRRDGWRVLVVWECQLKNRPGLTRRLRAFLDDG